MIDCEILEGVPCDADYIRLRDVAGLSPRSAEAARAGLAGTWYGVRAVCEGRVVGMGRIIGDGGCFFQIVDIAVEPTHQGAGLGRRIMEALMSRLRAAAPRTSQVTLLADGTAYQLYEKFGFKLSAPGSVGMILRL